MKRIPAFESFHVQHLLWLAVLTGWWLAVAANAADFVSVKSGAWFEPATWGQLTAFPFTGDNVTISNNDNVSLAFSNSLYLQISDLVLSNGTLSISTVSGQGLFAIAGTNSVWTNGTLGGVMLQLGTLNLIGNNGTYTGSAITNADGGIIRQIGAGNLIPFETSIANLPGGTYDFAGDGSVNAGQNNSLATFINGGVLLKSSGVNTSSVATTFMNVNGTIEVDSGTLTMPYNVGSTNGNFIVAAGATLDVTGGGNADWTGEITGSGAGRVALRSGMLAANPTLCLDFPDGLFQWTGSGMGGTVTNLGVITLSGTNTAISPGLLVNAGLFRHTNTAALRLYNTTVENLAGATYDLEGDGDFANGGFGVGGYFHNRGLFRKSSGTGISSFGGTAFANYGGTLEPDSGTLQISYYFIQTNGVTRLNGGNLAGGTFNYDGGTLTGTGIITGIVDNASSIVSPGDVLGVLNVIGTYSQGSGGALDITLGGTNAGEFSQLDVSGSASLDGNLNLSSFGGYSPSVGDQFQILSCASRDGTFHLPAGFPNGISVTYSNNGVFLLVTNAVVWPAQFSPPQLAAGSVDFGFQTITNQSYTVQRNDELTTTNWVDVTNFTGDGSLKNFALPITNVPHRFFRVREP